MTNAEQAVVHRWSTADTPVGQRLDRFAALMTEVLIPIRVSSEVRDFEVAMSFARLGPITIVRQHGKAHSSRRDTHEINRSGAHLFNLIVNPVRPWNFAHRGQQRLRPGDLTLHDSNYAFKIDQPDFQAVNIQMSEDWIKQWVARSAALLGSPISGDTGWGGVLSAYVQQLTPEFAVHSPLPTTMIADHLGALLALVADERGAGEASGRSIAALDGRIRDCIRLRGCDSSLEVSKVAATLNISPRTVHRSLAAHGETFVALLMKARVEIASRMLATRRFDALTTAEVGRRAGFSDPSHFTRVMRRLTGFTPSQMRRIRGTGA